MAVRRMYSNNILCSDAYLALPFSAQSLYIYLNTRADDDGFVNSPRTAVRTIGADEADLALLIERGYLLAFGNGVVAIKHWRAHNQLRKDRYTPTRYQELFSSLSISDAGEYIPTPTDPWQPIGNPGKVR